MATTDLSTTIERLAQQIEGDIRQRGLRPGDRYFTAAEASRLFDVGSMTIHRAMQSLAARQVLVRQRSRGTFVGPGFRPNPQVGQDLDVLHLVMAMDFHRTQSHSSDSLVDEFSQSLPGAVIQVHHLLDAAAERYIRRVVAQAGDAAREGFVLMRCSRSVQQIVAESGVPAVVYGQPYPDVALSCVKHDQETVGRLLAEYALSQGARRFALLMHARWRYGDHQMIDAATETLSGAGVALSELKLRSLSPEREVVEHVVREMLDEPEPPQAFLCRNDFYAAITWDVLSAAAGIATPCVVSGSHAPTDMPPLAAPIVRIQACMSLTEQVERLATLLTDRIRRRDAQPTEVLIPVQFERGPEQ